MNASEPAAPRLPVAAPAFDEPWQAQAHAMVQVLLQNGRVDAGRWSQALGLALRQRLEAGADDDTTTYYAALTDALTAMLAIDDAELGATVAAWRAAFQRTPHGQPVTLPPTDEVPASTGPAVNTRSGLKNIRASVGAQKVRLQGTVRRE